MQLQLFEVRIYKVKWKAFEELYDWDSRTFSRIFKGFGEKVIKKTTKRVMTYNEALSFAEYISTQCNEYAGWHEIIKVKN